MSSSLVRRAFRVAAAGSLAALAAACGAPGASIEPDLAMEPPDLTMVDLKAPGYPAGPYGGGVGEVLPNFVFPGYLAATQTTGLARELPFGEVSFDQLRTTPGAKYLLLTTAGFT